MLMEVDGDSKQREIKEKDLFKAAEEGDSSTFESLSPETLSKALSLRNEDARSLLHVAVSSGHSQVVKILSSIDASAGVINSVDEEGWAPLHSAASVGNLEIVETLLSKGADVNLKNGGGRTALHYAASKGWLKIAELLISHDAKINIKDKVALLLVRNGADVDVEDKEGYTVLGRATDEFRSILIDAAKAMLE